MGRYNPLSEAMLDPLLPRYSITNGDQNKVYLSLKELFNQLQKLISSFAQKGNSHKDIIINILPNMITL